MKTRTPLLHIVFAFLLFFSQQLATTHAISHLTAPQQTASQDQNLPGDPFCEQCLAFGSLGAALGGSPPPDLADLFAHEQTRMDFIERIIPSGLRPFNSRAPPVLA